MKFECAFVGRRKRYHVERSSSGEGSIDNDKATLARKGKVYFVPWLATNVKYCLFGHYPQLITEPRARDIKSWCSDSISRRVCDAWMRRRGSNKMLGICGNEFVNFPLTLGLIAIGHTTAGDFLKNGFFLLWRQRCFALLDLHRTIIVDTIP